MNQSKNQLMLGLSISAALLLALLVVLNAFPQARASVTISSGDYSAAAASVSSSKDYVYVVDNPTKRLIVYRYDSRDDKIERVDARDLAKDLRSR